MAQRIQLPDGRFAQFPDDMPINQIEEVLRKQFPPTAEAAPEAVPEEPGFFERIGTRLEGRGEDFDTIVDAFEDGDQGILESVFQTTGKVVAGGLVDIVGEGVATAAGSAFDTLNTLDDALTPGGTDNPLEAERNQAIAAVWNETIGPKVLQKAKDAANQGIEAYQTWAKSNPRFARNVEAVANIGLVFAPVKVRPGAAAGPSAPTVVGRAAEAVGRSVETKVARDRGSFVADLVRPKGTKKVREAEGLRTTDPQGLLGRQTVTPSGQEQAIASVVSDVAAVKPGNTLVQNTNAIKKEITTEATSLRKTLQSSPVKIPRADIKQSMDDVLTSLGENPLLVGDAAKTGKNTVARAKQFLGDNPNTPAGVLKARQDFDAWVEAQRPKVFDPVTDSPLSIAVGATRTAMNGIVADSVPTIAVRTSLNKQSQLFKARDNIAPKVADEAATNIGRLAQRVSSIVGLNKGLQNTLVKMGVGGAALGGSAFTAGAGATAAVLGGLGAVTVATKAVTSVQTRKAIRGLLNQSEKAIQKLKKQGPKAAPALRQLRADRAVVIEILKSGDK